VLAESIEARLAMGETIDLASTARGDRRETDGGKKADS
jgi:hypothetical protein